jgi:aspartyl aminopeptidase
MTMGVWYRNQSSIIAFALPKSFKAGNPHAFAIVGAHTDSCNFKLRPISKRRKPADSNYMAIGGLACTIKAIVGAYANYK